MELELGQASIQPRKECECYMTEQLLLSIKNLEKKVRQHEEERVEYQKELRAVLMEKEELRAMLEQVRNYHPSSYHSQPSQQTRQRKRT